MLISNILYAAHNRREKSVGNIGDDHYHNVVWLRRRLVPTGWVDNRGYESHPLPLGASPDLGSIIDDVRHGANGHVGPFRDLPHCNRRNHRITCYEIRVSRLAVS